MKTVKKDFPIFTANPLFVYLDSAATALKPRCVIDAVTDYYENYPANVHRGMYRMSEKATEKYEGARKTAQKFINAKSEKEIIFTSGTTMAINMIAKGWGAQNLKSGDEIILSVMEHHSNIVPWQMIAKEKKCVLKYADMDKNRILKIGQFTKLLTKRTKLVAITHVSNALGTINPLKLIIQKAHSVGARALVDAAQSAPHLPIDVQYLDCDFLAFSGHKMCGPTGIGVLYAKEKILASMEPFFGGGNMITEVLKNKSRHNELPWKFEAGTPPIAEAIGLARAIEYLEKIGMNEIREHEKKLLRFAIAELKKMPCVTIFGPCNPEIQSGIVSFNVNRVHPHDVATILDSDSIAIRAGHHCCMPLMEKLKTPATCRVSFYIYNSEEDVIKLIKGINKIKKLFKV